MGTYSILEADKLYTELRMIDWILYQVCSNEVKRIERRGGRTQVVMNSKSDKLT
jgi:hypothetical protein